VHANRVNGQIIIGLTTFYTIFAIFEIKSLHYLLFLAMALHLVGYFATAIYLLVHVREKNSATYVFTDDTNLSGWDNAGVSAQPEKNLLACSTPLIRSLVLIADSRHIKTGCLVNRLADACYRFR
jgi:hypothetical protein